MLDTIVFFSTITTQPRIDSGSTPENIEHTMGENIKKYFNELLLDRYVEYLVSDPNLFVTTNKCYGCGSGGRTKAN